MPEEKHDWPKYGAVAAILALPLAVAGILTTLYIEPLQCFVGAKQCFNGDINIAIDPPRPPDTVREARFTVESEGAAEVHAFVRSRLEEGKQINSVSFQPGGGWLVVWDRNQYHSKGLTGGLRSVLDSLVQTGASISDVVFAPWPGTDTWAIIHGNGEVTASAPPPGARLALEEARRAGRPVLSIAFLGLGSWLVVDRDRFDSGGPGPAPVLEEVRGLLRVRLPQTLRLLEPGGYFAQYDERSWTASGLPRRLSSELERLRSSNKRVQVAAFTSEGGWLIVAEAG
jgi:hypothetical protein